MIPDAATRDEIEALLRWYVDMGVDIAIDAEPHDRFAEAAEASATALAARPEPEATGAAEQGRRAPSSPAGAGLLPGLAAPPTIGGAAAHW